MSRETNGLAVPPKLSLSRLRRAILEELCVTGRRLGTLGWQTSDGSKVGPKIPQNEFLLSRENAFSAEAKSATGGDPCRRDRLNPLTFALAVTERAKGTLYLTKNAMGD